MKHKLNYWADLEKHNRKIKRREVMFIHFMSGFAIGFMTVIIILGV
jgi:hypothetical protein